MNKRRFTGLLLIILSLFVIFGGITLTDAWLQSPLPLDEAITIEIEKGMTGREIANLLKQKNVINSTRSFRWAIWFKDAERDLRLGTVRLKPPLNLNRLINKLQKKSPHLIRVQLQEGWPSWRIFKTLSRKLNLTREGFEQLFENKKFLRRHGIKAKSLEGYLFPDTYYISADAGHREVINQLLNRFKEVRSELNLSDRARKLGLTVDEAVRLASIIQREAKIPRERPIVSAVFHNRLDRGYQLQADPTVLYPIRSFDVSITHSMLENDNPYNTYQNPGLPPTAICNPGKPSLKASVNPADVPYLYFVSKGDGSHAFSEKLSDHREAVKRYQEND
ncbi:MAG: endolytic transglycosylase MltG [bacterium]